MGKSKLKQQLKRKLSESDAPQSKKQQKTQHRDAARAQDDDANGHDDSELREIAELDFDDALAAGLAFEQMESFDGALAAFQAAVKARPDSVLALSHLADVYAAGGQHEQALATYLKATQLPDADASVWFRLGVTRLALGQHLGAVASMNTAKQMTLEALGSASSDSREHADLMKAYSVTLAALANCFGEMGDIDSAVREYEAAVAKFPTNGDLHYNLATMLLARGDQADGIASLVLAISCSPETVAFYEDLIECLQASSSRDDTIVQNRIAALQDTLAELIAAKAANGDGDDSDDSDDERASGDDDGDSSSERESDDEVETDEE